MEYKVTCVIHTPKNKRFTKVIIVNASTDAEAILRAEERFNKYLYRVGYRVEVLFYEQPLLV